MTLTNEFLFIIYAAMVVSGAVIQARRTKYGRAVRFVAALLIIPSVPLLLLRRHPLILQTSIVAVIYFIEIVLLTLCLILNQQQFPLSLSLPATERRYPPKRSFKAIFGISALLLGCTIVMFDVPLHQHFWAGTDEGYILMGSGRALWSVISDLFQSRPLARVQGTLAFLFSPNTPDGFLWITTLLRFLSAVLIFGITSRILRKHSPHARLIAISAAVLFIIEPSEIARFLAIYTWGYAPSVFFLLLATWLFLESYVRKQLWALFAACFALGLSILCIETSLILSLAIPILLLTIGRRTHLWLWFSAWLATVLLFGMRFAAFLFSGSSYPSTILGHAPDRLTTVLENVAIQVSGFFSMLRFPNARGEYWGYGLLAALLTLLVFRIFVSRPVQAQTDHEHRQTLGQNISMDVRSYS
jgi:hypothetical protein